MSDPFTFDPLTYTYTVTTPDSTVSIATLAASPVLICVIDGSDPVSCDWSGAVQVPGTLTIHVYVPTDVPALVTEYSIQFTH
jgi:hypothetical protein